MTPAALLGNAMLEAIGRQVEVLDSDVTIDIRADDTTLYESETGELFVETSTATYELSVTGSGVVPTETVMDTSTMMELEPAERENDQIDSGGIASTSTKIMD